MIDPCAREERIAIREYCGRMSERKAIELIDTEQTSLAGLEARIAAMARHQAQQPKHYKFTPRRTDGAMNENENAQ